MKAITILQPWASLIACGAKKIETRSWPTSYRGALAIHAGMRIKKDAAFTNPIYSTLTANGIDPGEELPVGAVIAIVDLIECIEMAADSIVYWKKLYGVNEIAFGDFSPGRYAWILSNVRKIDPVPVKGMQRVWNWEN